MDFLDSLFSNKTDPVSQPDNGSGVLDPSEHITDPDEQLLTSLSSESSILSLQRQKCDSVDENPVTKRVERVSFK